MRSQGDKRCPICAKWHWAKQAWMHEKCIDEAVTEGSAVEVKVANAKPVVANKHHGVYKDHASNSEGMDVRRPDPLGINGRQHFPAGVGGVGGVVERVLAGPEEKGRPEGCGAGVDRKQRWSRAEYNAYQRELMRKRRAEAKQRAA